LAGDYKESGAFPSLTLRGTLCLAIRPTIAFADAIRVQQFLGRRNTEARRR